MHTVGRTRSDVDWAGLKADFAAGELPMAALARKYGLGAATISRRARREGWPRGGRAKAVAERFAESRARACDAARVWQAEIQDDPIRVTVKDLHRLVRRLTRDLNRRLAAGPADSARRDADPRMLNALSRAVTALAVVERENRRAAAEARAAAQAQNEPGSMGAEAAWAEVQRRLQRLADAHEEREAEAAGLGGVG